MAHYTDIERFTQLAGELPLSFIWRTVLAQTWLRILGAPPRPTPPSADGKQWKRLSELEKGKAPAPKSDQTHDSAP